MRIKAQDHLGTSNSMILFWSRSANNPRERFSHLMNDSCIIEKLEKRKSKASRFLHNYASLSSALKTTAEWKGFFKKLRRNPSSFVPNSPERKEKKVKIFHKNFFFFFGKEFKNQITINWTKNRFLQSKVHQRMTDERKRAKLKKERESVQSDDKKGRIPKKKRDISFSWPRPKLRGPEDGRETRRRERRRRWRMKREDGEKTTCSN